MPDSYKNLKNLRKKAIWYFWIAFISFLILYKLINMCENYNYIVYDRVFHSSFYLFFYFVTKIVSVLMLIDILYLFRTLKTWWSKTGLVIPLLVTCLCVFIWDNPAEGPLSLIESKKSPDGKHILARYGKQYLGGDDILSVVGVENNNETPKTIFVGQEHCTINKMNWLDNQTVQIDNLKIDIYQSVYPPHGCYNF